MDNKQMMAFIEPTLAHYQKGGWVFPKGASASILKAVNADITKQAVGGLSTLATLAAINKAIEAAGKRG